MVVFAALVPSGLYSFLGSSGSCHLVQSAKHDEVILCIAIHGCRFECLTYGKICFSVSDGLKVYGVLHIDLWNRSLFKELGLDDGFFVSFGRWCRPDDLWEWPPCGFD